jgi:hypothetical protein
LKHLSFLDGWPDSQARYRWQNSMRSLGNRGGREAGFAYATLAAEEQDAHIRTG